MNIFRKLILAFKLVQVDDNCGGLQASGLLIVLHLLYLIHMSINISFNWLQNLLYFLPENPNIFYFLEFFKSYIFVEVDFDHWVYPQLSPSLSSLHSILPRKLAIQKQVGTGCLKKTSHLEFLHFTTTIKMIECWDIFHLKGGIHSSVLSTKTFLSNIRKLRYKQIKLGYQISKIIDIRPS